MSKEDEKMPLGAEGGLPKLEELEPDEPQPQQQQKPSKIEPNGASSDLQQLVNTLSQALKSIVVPSESIEAKRNVRAPHVYSVGQCFKTWLSQFL